LTGLALNLDAIASTFPGSIEDLVSSTVAAVNHEFGEFLCLDPNNRIEGVWHKGGGRKQKKSEMKIHRHPGRIGACRQKHKWDEFPSPSIYFTAGIHHLPGPRTALLQQQVAG
jgi:hypothetical protein